MARVERHLEIALSALEDLLRLPKDFPSKFNIEQAIRRLSNPTGLS